MQDIFKIPQISTELSAVEELIHAALKTEEKSLKAITEYTFGGKHLRPQLALLTAKCFSETIPQEIISASAALELIHHATLLHDDIVDNAQTRRYKPSVVSKYGLSNALLAGDFLYIRAFGLCKNLDAVCGTKLEETCIKLTEGEFLEMNLQQADYNLETALKICGKKTAPLFSLATFLGAYYAKCTEQVVTLMTEFGEYLGIAFQILDDILDVTSTNLGKQRGLDLYERKPSIVNVLWLKLESDNPKKFFTPSTSNDWHSFVPNALNSINNSNVISDAYDLADSFLAKAKNNLDEAVKKSAFYDQKALENLRELLNYSSKRQM